MKQVLPVEGDFGGTVLITCVFVAVGTTAVHLWSDVKTTHLCICKGVAHSVIKTIKESPYFKYLLEQHTIKTNKVFSGILVSPENDRQRTHLSCKMRYPAHFIMFMFYFI